MVKIKYLWNRHLVMMEMGARCPSKFLASKIQEFPRMKHVCWEWIWVYGTVRHNYIATEKVLFTPPFFCQFLPEILWKTAYILTWSKFHRSPNGDASLKTAFMASNSRDEPFRKSTLTLKSSEVFWNIFSSYILLPFRNNMYIWKCTARQQKKTRSWQRGFFF